MITLTEPIPSLHTDEHGMPRGCNAWCDPAAGVHTERMRMTGHGVPVGGGCVVPGYGQATIVAIAPLSTEARDANLDVAMARIKQGRSDESDERLVTIRIDPPPSWWWESPARAGLIEVGFATGIRYKGPHANGPGIPNDRIDDL